MDKIVNYYNLKDSLKAVEDLVWKIIFFNLREIVDHLLINCWLGGVISEISIF
jgi:hypothetical protein